MKSERPAISTTALALIAALILIPTASDYLPAKGQQTDPWSPRVVNVIQVGGNPSGIAVDSVTDVVYVLDGGVEALNGSTGAILGTVSISSAHGIAVDPATDRVYVATWGSSSSNINSTSNSIYVVDGATLGVVSIIPILPVESYPYGIAVDSTTDMVYVSNENWNTVSVINGTDDSLVATVKVGANPNGIAVDPVTNKVYVTSYTQNLYEIDGGNYSVVADTSLLWPVFAVAVDPATDLVYAVSPSYKGVAIVDGATDNVTAYLFTKNFGSQNPTGISVDPTTNMVYFAGGGSVSVLPGASNAVQDYVTVENGPEGVAVDPSTGLVYVADNGGYVSIISSAPGPTSTNVTCGVPTKIMYLGNSTTCNAVVVGSSPTGNVTWTSSGSGSVSFSPGTCPLSGGECGTAITATRAGEVTVNASYGGDAVNPPSFASLTFLVSQPVNVAGDLVQHKFVLPAGKAASVDVNLPSPVVGGDVLVVGAAFNSSSGGTISDTLSNSWNWKPDSSQTFFAGSSQDGTDVWLARSAESGDDTIQVSGVFGNGNASSVLVVDVFELRNANLSVIGAYGGSGLGYVDCSTCHFSDASFVLDIAVSTDAGANSTCRPAPSQPGIPGQTPGFVIEPFCGTVNEATRSGIYAEYGLIGTPNFVVELSSTGGASLSQTVFVALDNTAGSDAASSSLSSSSSSFSSMTTAGVPAVTQASVSRTSPESGLPGGQIEAAGIVAISVVAVTVATYTLLRKSQP